MKQKVTGRQNISRMCFVCGIENKSGLKTKFYELGNGELLALFTPENIHQGYPGRLHGGIANTILDETMGRAIMIRDNNIWGVTVELTTKFRKPIPLDQEIKVIGRITDENSRMFEGTGEILLPDGNIAVSGKGKYFKLPIEKIADPAFLDEWFEDNRGKLPKEVEI